MVIISILSLVLKAQCHAAKQTLSGRQINRINSQVIREHE